MTLEQTYKILEKHGDKFTIEEYTELSRAIADHGFYEWKTGREKMKQTYNIKY